MSETATLLHITDCHLFAHPEQDKNGFNTNESFRRVLDAVKVFHQQTPCEGLWVTGDIVHDEYRAGYQRFAAMVSELGIPVHTVAGNHDTVSFMQEIVKPEVISCHEVVTLDDWVVIGLNSHLSGDYVGELSDDELARLKEILQEYAGWHTAIAVHHPPVDVDSRWIDESMIRNAADFWDVVRLNSAVKLIFCGHVHQNFAAVQNGVMVLSSPSTCFQFKPQATDMQIDDAQPGFRWIRLHQDGHVASGVLRV